MVKLCRNYAPRAFTRADKRDIFRDAVFLCKTPFVTPRINSGCASFNAVRAAVWSFCSYRSLNTAQMCAQARQPIFINFRAPNDLTCAFFGLWCIGHDVCIPLYPEVGFKNNSPV